MMAITTRSSMRVKAFLMEAMSFDFCGGEIMAIQTRITPPVRHISARLVSFSIQQSAVSVNFQFSVQ